MIQREVHTFILWPIQIPGSGSKVIVLISRIGVSQTAAQCQPRAEYSIRGMFLRGHGIKAAF